MYELVIKDILPIGSNPDGISGFTKYDDGRICADTVTHTQHYGLEEGSVEISKEQLQSFIDALKALL